MQHLKLLAKEATVAITEKQFKVILFCTNPQHNFSAYVNYWRSTETNKTLPVYSNDLSSAHQKEMRFHSARWAINNKF